MRYANDDSDLFFQNADASYVHESVLVPILKEITLCDTVLDLSAVERYFPVPREFMPVTQQLVFFFEMPNKSMENAGMLKGDMLLVQCVDAVTDGERTVTMINNAVAVGIYHNYNGMHYIVPENDFMEPVVADAMVPVGKIIGSMRMMG